MMLQKKSKGREKAKRSFQQRIIGSFIIAYVFIAAASITFYYFVNRRSIGQYTVEHYKEMMWQIDRNINQQLSKMYSTAMTLSTNPTLKQYFEKGIMSMNAADVNDDTLTVRKNAEELIASFMHDDRNIKHITLMDKVKGRSDFYYDNGYFSEESEARVRKEEWFKDTVNDSRMHWIGKHKGIYENGEEYYFGCAVGVRNMNSFVYGVIYLAYGTDIITKNISKFVENRFIDYYVIDDSERIIVSNNDSLINHHISETKIPSGIIEDSNIVTEQRIGQRNYIIANNLSEKYQWKVIQVANIDKIYSPLNKILLYTAFGTAASILFFYMLARMISIRLTRPVRKIVKAIERIGTGDLDTEVGYSSSDELGVISKALDNMTAQIKSYIGELKEEERAIKEAEINALQAQINPHFMYNTLNAIKFMAMMKNDNNIVNTIGALINILKNTFNYKRTFITVEEELENIDKYCVIMKVRYNSKFDIEYNIEEGVKKASIFKFMLQPVIENAILHGIAPKSGLGKIIVNARAEEDTILFEVIDDGVGIKAEDMEDIKNNKNGKFNSIGINNIDERIKLYYGKAFGVILESTVGQGTKVTITLPEILGGENIG